MCQISRTHNEVELEREVVHVIVSIVLTSSALCLDEVKVQTSAPRTLAERTT
jgi:hypothetical protein